MLVITRGYATFLLVKVIMSVLMSPIFQAPAGYIPNVRCVHPRTPASLVLRALLNLKLDKHLVFVTG
jgi:hypothetical protein